MEDQTNFFAKSYDAGSEGAAPSYQDEVEAEYPIPKINLYAPPYSEDNARKRREKFLTKKHTISEKM